MEDGHENGSTVGHSFPVILSLSAAIPAVDGVGQGLPLRQTRLTSIDRLSQSGASLAVCRTAPLAMARRRAAELLGPELGGTDRLSADALRGRYRTRCLCSVVSSSPYFGDASAHWELAKPGIQKHNDGGEKVKPSSSEPPLPPNLARAQAALMGKPLGRPVTAPEQVASPPTTPAAAPKPDLRDSKADRESAILAAATAALTGKSMEEIAKADQQEPSEEVTQSAEYREGNMGNGLKSVGRFIPLIVLLGCAAAGIAFWFYHAHEVKLREAEAVTAKEEYAKSVVADMVNTWHADDHWEKSLSSPGNSSRTLYTIELEKALIQDRPLIVFGSVDDLSKAGQSENSIISIWTETRANLSPALRLSLLSPPEITNAILGQKDRASEMFVLAVKISSVEKISMPSNSEFGDHFLAHGVLFAAKPIDVYEPPAESRQPNH